MLNTFYYLLVIGIWGSTWLAITFQLGVVPPAVSIAYRFLLASLLLLVYCRLRGRPLQFSRRTHRWMMLQGILLFGINYWLFYVAELWLTSGLVAVLFTLLVPMNTLNARIFLGQPIRRSVLAGGALGLTGILLVFSPELQNIHFSANELAGIGLSCAATYSASLGNILSARNQAHGIPVLQANAFGMGYGGGLMLIAALIFGHPLTPEWTISYLGSLFYLALFGSVVAFGSYLSLVGRIGADRAAYTTLLFPIVALFLSALFEQYTFPPLAMAGIALVCVGNMIALDTPLSRWVCSLRQTQSA